MTDTQEQTTSRTRNKRAKLEDHFPSDPVKGDVASKWSAFVNACRTAEIKVGTSFDGGEAGKFTTNLFDYPCHVVLRLAQKADHNKHMDSYADPVQAPNPIHEVRTVNAELVKGVWSTRGEGGPRITDLAHALAELSKNAESRAALGFDGEYSAEDLQTALDAKSKEERATYAKHPAIKQAIDTIRAKRAVEAAKESAKKAKGVALPKLFG